MMKRLLGDIEAILLTDIPYSLRLAVVICALLVSHLLGLAWVFVVEYERAAVVAEVRGELTEVRNQVRQLWQAYEATRRRTDRAELDGKVAGRGK